MSIMILEGPIDPDPIPAAPPNIVRAVMASLTRRANEMGQAVTHHVCKTEEELVHRLDRAQRNGSDIVLLDPGACTRGPRLLETLRDLEIPYIEVHDDRSDRPEPLLPPKCGPSLAVITGYGTQSFDVAMTFALDTLGCTECANDYHVGT